MSFSINCLEITASKEIVEKNSNIYKNLLTAKEFLEPEFKFPKRFFFNDYYKREPDAQGNLDPNEPEKRFNSDLFFSKKINIQAIVGMNGYGKSSLLDLLYMAINNFCFMYERGKKREHAQKLFFVRDLFVNLYFSIDGDEHRLVCYGNIIELQIKYKSDFIPVCDVAQRVKASFKLSKYDELDFPDNSEEKLYYLMQDFFYTIATNYSIQSLLPNDYNQKIFSFDATEKQVIPYHDEKKWIESIFQKNDGYVCPIVLNPKREVYGINMALEKELAKYREIALLIWARNHGTRFLDEYELYDVKYTFNKNYVLQKTGFKTINEVLNDIDGKLYIPAKGIADIDEIDPLSVEFKLLIDIDSPIIVKLALALLIKKIHSITANIPYTTYGLDGKRSAFYNNGSLNIVHFSEMLNVIEKDKSHTVTKIKQMIHFLQKNWMNNSRLKKLADGWLRYGFSLSDYENEICKGKDLLDDIICNLPPSMFKYEIFLKNISTGEIVNMALLSSGESQMIQTLSTHMYHIRNVLSIKEANKVFYENGELKRLRPEYNCINLIFDEVEICFHPEYQRLFVSKLIKMLVNMKMTDECSFNIFIVTHSPFVLSDIPNENILFLEKGKQIEPNFKTYAQNISAILRRGFFLKSFMGEYAKDFLNHFIDERKEKRIDDLTYKKIMNQIGDEFLKSEIKQYCEDTEME
ncbi:AAA family ATPase [Fibrobacter sp.]|uniref:AAA family ATPase n=1 Tax=Fibrobacter sp. TaxID=35828 RepID=UPI00388D3362